MIETMAVHPDWQEKCYQEVVDAVNKHSKDTHLPLVDRLTSIPLKAWETSFPTFDLCLYEIIRVWTSFAVGRLNVSNEAIPIPGSDEVIPPGAFAVWNSTELNFNENLFPSPRKFDPMRFTEGRREFEQETHGCMYSPNYSTLVSDTLANLVKSLAGELQCIHVQASVGEGSNRIFSSHTL